jgi:outer membrane lipoprotein-sorting protein
MRKAMHPIHKLALTVAIALILLPSRAASAADDKDRVLRRLDAAAKQFRNTSADFVFDKEQIDPVPDSDIQTGTVYYERNGAAFKTAAHIDKANTRPVTRVYTYSAGLLTFFDKATNQVTRFSKFANFESYIMLGFGASGKELEDKWDIKYLGSEMVAGVKTEKLELVAKDPEVRKNIAKVTIWIDPDRAVSLKQRFDENASNYRICTYTNFKTNQSLPSDAFTFKTDAQTTYSNK